MKSLFQLLAILLIIQLAFSQIVPSLQQVDRAQIVNTSEVIPIRPLMGRPFLSLATVEPYHCIVDVAIETGDNKHLQFWVFFSNKTSGCTYSVCFYGWIVNYTADGVTTLGYPEGNATILPIFQFNANSETDYQILRNNNLGQNFVNVIEIACENFNPTVASPTPAKLNQFAPNQNTASQNYNFVPLSSLATRNSDFFSSTSLRTNLQGGSFRPQITLVPQIDPDILSTYGVSDQSKIQNMKVASLSANFKVNGLKTSKSRVSQKLAFDSSLELLTLRSRSVDLDLTTDYLADNKGNIKNFISNVDLKISKKSSILINIDSLKALVDSFSTTPKFSFSGIQVQALRARAANIKLNQNTFKTVDQIRQSDPIVNVNQVFNGFDIEKEVAKSRFVSKPIVTPKIPFSTTAAPSFNSLIQAPTATNQKLNVFQPASPIIVPIFAIKPFPNTFLKENKVLFSKTILGKTVSVRVGVTATMVTAFQVQVVGTLYYSVFDKQKQIKIFDYTQNVAYNWQWSKSFSGTLNFQISISLPPPISFITINFDIKLTLYITVKVFANGSHKASINAYVFKTGIYAETGLTTDSTASLRLVVVQGGVFLTGTIVKVSTDPTLTLTYRYLKNQLQIDAEWNFYLQAFKMQWGFFWRYWTLWSGWSQRQIIAQWTINGFYGKYLIYQKSNVIRIW